MLKILPHAKSEGVSFPIVEEVCGDLEEELHAFSVLWGGQRIPGFRPGLANCAPSACFVGGRGFLESRGCLACEEIDEEDEEDGEEDFVSNGLMFVPIGVWMFKIEFFLIFCGSECLWLGVLECFSY